MKLLHLVPVSFREANAFVAEWHRHNQPVRGMKFAVGAADSDGILRGIAIAGRPIARHFDDGMTLEVLRTATDGAANCNSMLYGACRRAAFALGYRRLITYTQADEAGSSLKAAGWTVIAERPPRKGWDTASRRRDNSSYSSVPRRLWEVVA